VKAYPAPAPRGPSPQRPQIQTPCGEQVSRLCLYLVMLMLIPPLSSVLCLLLLLLPADCGQ
jgi:hypothetical protein